MSNNDTDELTGNARSNTDDSTRQVLSPIVSIYAAPPADEEHSFNPPEVWVSPPANPFGIGTTPEDLPPVVRSYDIKDWRKAVEDILKILQSLGPELATLAVETAAMILEEKNNGKK